MSREQAHDKQDQPKRNRLNVSNLESAIDHQSLIETQIREAMERGDFDNLRGAGKPQNLARDPNVPEEMEMAYNLLKHAGYAPDWIETRKEVDVARAKLFAPFQRFRAKPPKDPPEYARVQNKLVEQFRVQAAELNKLIDLYNLKAPNMQVHLHRIRIEAEIEKFQIP
ncbi:MAG: hypothetical protein B6D41_18955 [Chloroflexi bacterium UTCFX4]|jgi:hypothetical protein|nr:MAG: hypothetical protein B6D41_18955 [Chloroflexi bacterium UTCFX4]